MQTFYIIKDNEEIVNEVSVKHGGMRHEVSELVQELNSTGLGSYHMTKFPSDSLVKFWKEKLRAV